MRVGKNGGPRGFDPRFTRTASVATVYKPYTNLVVRACVCGWSQGFFFSDYASKDGQAGDVLIAPSLPGEIVCIPMDGSMEWTIQKGSYLWWVLALPTVATRGWSFALR